MVSPDRSENNGSAAGAACTHGTGCLAKAVCSTAGGRERWARKQQSNECRHATRSILGLRGSMRQMEQEVWVVWGWGNAALRQPRRPVNCAAQHGGAACWLLRLQPQAPPLAQLRRSPAQLRQQGSGGRHGG